MSFHHVEEIQLTYAAAYWRDKQFIDSFYGKIKPSFFSDASLGGVIGLIDLYYGRYKKAPVRSSLLDFIRRSYPEDTEVHKRQREKFGLIVSQLETEDISDRQFLLDQISEFLTQQAITEAIEASINDVQAGKYDASMVERFQLAVQYGSIKIDQGTMISRDGGSSLMREANPEFRKIIPTGINHLDQMINGGGRAGELLILLAPPKGFKSGSLLNIGWNARRIGQDKTVVYLTLELSEQLQTLRFAQRTTSQEKERLYDNPGEYVEVFERNLKILHGNKGEFIFKFFPPAVCTCKTIRRYLDGLIQEGVVPDVLIIDYIDLLGSDSKKEKDYLEKLVICTELRQIAIDYDVVCWTAARATREAIGKKRINMSHMSGTIERVAVADMVLALCQTDEERANGEIRIVPVAARNDAGDRVIHCKMEPSKMYLQSVESRELADEDLEEDDDDDRGGRRGGGGGVKGYKDKVRGIREKASLEARKAVDD